MAEPLSAIRQKIERLLGEAKTGTPDGYYAVNTFGCAALGMFEDDYFNDWQGRFYSGTHKDTSFVVSDFTKAGGIVEFLPSLSVKTDATDLFELIPPDFSTDEINDAINLSISMVGGEALQDAVDTSIEIVASVYEYPIPSDFLYLEQIYQEESTAGRYSASAGLMDLRHWRILHGSSARVWFDSYYASLTAGRHLRLVGQKKPSQLSLDADTSAVSLVFLVYQAKAMLHQSRVRGQGSDFEEHQSQMALAQTMADRERTRLQVIGRGRKVAY